MSIQKPTIHIVGAGLAGSECALQLAEMGYAVTLIEMRDQVMTPAHRTAKCAELVCSNSFGSLAGTSAPGQLKWEAEHLHSKILEAAWKARVPAGQALGMDREVFADEITRRVHEHPHIRFDNRVVESLDEIPRPCVIATGPLTHGRLAEGLREHFGDEFLYFFDAIAPIIDADSINMEIAWRADRWDKGTKDYINCPMSKREYFFFVEEVKAARKIEPKEFECNSGTVPDTTPYFESCMPIEAMIERGDLTPRFGPMSAKGLRDPRTGNMPFAVVQLRQDNKEATAYNMVGFQTKMAYAEQKRVFRLIPGLEEAEFLKLGSIHRNLYINTPKRLNRDLSSRKDPLLFFAGQITGVEGYFESACMGLLVARFLDAKVRGELASDAANIDIDGIAPPRATAMGSLLAAISDETKIDHFQPTNINFGHMPPPAEIPEPELKPEFIAGKHFKRGFNTAAKRGFDKTAKRMTQLANARAVFISWLRSRGLEPKPNPSVEAAAQALIEATETNQGAKEKSLEAPAPVSV